MAYNVSIATRPLVYSTFRYINNKVWNALAEYIDNSIQSFENHIDVLKAINKDGKLHVSVSIDFDKDVITIVDDAYGIEEEKTRTTGVLTWSSWRRGWPFLRHLPTTVMVLGARGRSRKQRVWD